MKFNMTKIAAALALTTVAAGAQAAVVGPTDMRITAGAWRLGFPGSGFIPFTSFGANDITDQYNPAGWDTTVAQPIGVLAPGATLSFALGTESADQVNVFFAPTAPGSIGGGAAPVFAGSLVNGNVSSISMLSMFFNWNG
jgi:hypothetical protein